MELSEYIQRLKDVNAPVNQLKAAFTRRVKGLVLETFDAQRNPYGVVWAPLKYRPTPPPIMNLSGDTRRSLGAKTTDTGITVWFDTYYAKFHQTGTRFMEARKLLPGNKWPVKWVQEINKYWLDAATRYFAI